METGQRAISRRTLLGSATAVAAAGVDGPGTGTAPPRRHRRDVPPLGASSAAPRTPTPRSRTSAEPAAAAVPHTSPAAPCVANVLDYGAEPDGSADAAPAINRAIAAAGRARRRHGHHPAGTYRIDDLIRIGHSNVVLRGAGSGRTTLYATKNLTELIGPYGSRYGGDKSSWSWAGGLIWLCPKARWDSPHRRHQGQGLALRGLDRQQARRVAHPRPPSGPPAAATGRSPSPTHSQLRRGAPGPAPPRRRRRPHPPGAHGGRRRGPRGVRLGRQDQADLVRPLRMARPHRRRARRGRVTLERPLPLDMRPEWDPRLDHPRHAAHRLRCRGPDPGGDRDPAVRSTSSTRATTASRFQCAYDCWADDITVRHVDNGFGLVAASACTLRRTRVAGRGSHHPYFCREGSHDNLVEDFTIAQRTVPAPRAPSSTASTSRACPATTSGRAGGWRWAPSTPTAACRSPTSAPTSPSTTTAATAATPARAPSRRPVHPLEHPRHQRPRGPGQDRRDRPVQRDRRHQRGPRVRPDRRPGLQRCAALPPGGVRHPGGRAPAQSVRGPAGPRR